MVDSGESIGPKRISLGDVWSDIAVRTLGVGDEGCNELLVAGIGEIKRFLAVRI